MTHRWISTVRETLESTQDEATREGLQQRLHMFAATCFSTFDVCPEHIPNLLANDEDFSIAMQCAIIVYHNTVSPSEDNSFYLTRMLSRHRRLLHDLEPSFRQSDSTDPDRLRLSHSSGYDHALTRLWPAFRGTSTWRALPRPNSPWIFCATESGQQVHYDLLTGQLLIDGKPLGRLPRQIVTHPTYASIFGAVSDTNKLLPVRFLSLFVFFREF